MAELVIEQVLNEGGYEPHVVSAPEVVQFGAPVITNRDEGILSCDGIYVTIKAKNGTWRYLITKWDADTQMLHAKLVSSDTLSRAAS